LSKQFGGTVEAQQDVESATREQGTKFLSNNEKSKAKETPNFAGSGIWRYKGYTVCKPLDV
jgi:hypothetical protein